MLTHSHTPSLLPPSLNRCGHMTLSLARSLARWLAGGVFAGAEGAVSETSRHLHAIFVERNLALWKAPNVLAWLQTVVKNLLHVPDPSSPFSPAHVRARGG
eukprot:1679955-Rhodomonas_salina.1